MRVEETFALQEPASHGSKRVGEACYVAATINNRRYYGTLVDQDALKSASLLYFQDTAAGLEINQRMKIMKQRQVNKIPSKTSGPNDACEGDNGPSPMKIPSATHTHSDAGTIPSTQQIQKYKYVESSIGKSSDYRVLLATFASVDAAAEDDLERSKAIRAACQSGGDFVGNYYYQYEVRSAIDCKFAALNN